MARFRDLAGAEAASSSLHAAGIGNELYDAWMVGMLWTYSTAVGWIRLRVDDSDANQAREVLETPAIADWPVDPAPEAAAERCPVCGSGELAVESGARKTLALWLAVRLFLPITLWFWRSRLVCRACGASRALPLTFRPEIVIVWLIVAVALYLALAAGFMLAGGAVNVGHNIR